MEDQGQLSKVFVKKTRKGKVVKLVREKYLRDDTGFGCMFGKCLAKVRKGTHSLTHSLTHSFIHSLGYSLS